MKLKLKPPLRGIVRDSLSLKSSEYFCLLNRNTAQFFRIVGRQQLEILVSVAGDSSGANFLEGFFKQMTSHVEYYGQPITLLLNNAEAFSYMQILVDQKATQVLENVRLIQSEKIAFSHTVRRDTTRPIFIGQGINKAYLAQLDALAQKYKVLLLAIESLSVFLAINIPRANLQESGIAVFQTGEKEFFYLLWDKRGNLVFVKDETFKKANSLSEKVNNLRITFFKDEPEFQVYFYSHLKSNALTSAESIPLSNVLTSGFHSSQSIRRNLYKPRTATVSKYVKTTANSMRLLIFILAEICILGMVAVGITAVVASGGDEVTSDFQTYYSQNMTLQSELENLIQLNQKLSAQLPKTLQAAELVSAFCQKQERGVYLTQLYIDNTKIDSVRIEAKGISKKESNVFLYHQQLKDELSPHSLSVNSLKQEIQNSRGSVDTVFAFNFGAFINEAASSK